MRRQTKWQEEQRKQGRCVDCGKPTEVNKRGRPMLKCKKHREHSNEYQRRRKSKEIRG